MNNDSNQSTERCTRCGYALTGVDFFCPGCGKQLFRNTAPISTPVQASPPKKRMAAWKKITLFCSLGTVATVLFVLSFLLADLKDYTLACAVMDRGEYGTAYEMFAEFEEYKDSPEKLDECVYQWVDDILESGDVHEAYNLMYYVEPESDQCETVYNKIVADMATREITDAQGDIDSSTLAIWAYLLTILPPDYEDTGALFELVQTFWTGDYWDKVAYIRESYREIEALWHYEAVQTLMTRDEVVTAFLEGKWETRDRDYYLEFFENEEGTTSVQTTLPKPETPPDMAYYDIISLIYIYEDMDDNELAKVFRFEIVDYDEMTVYCYADGKTHTLYR